MGKPTAQSSFWPQYPGPSSFAVDGLHATDPSGALLFCTHTLQEATPWWGVDLEASYAVAVVRVMNRANSRQNIQYQTIFILSYTCEHIISLQVIFGWPTLTSWSLLTSSIQLSRATSSCVHTLGDQLHVEDGWKSTAILQSVEGKFLMHYFTNVPSFFHFFL